MIRHLHFVQSLEPLEGAGLGSSALGLHEGFLQLDDVQSFLAATCHRNGCSNSSFVIEARRRLFRKLFFSPDYLIRSRPLAASADIIHGHGFYTFLNFKFGEAARELGKILVYHAQGFFEPYILSRSRLKKRIVHSLFEDLNFRSVMLWRATNDKEATQIKNMIPSARILILPNGVHLPEPNQCLCATERAHESSERILLFFSRIHPKKGLDILIEAWSRIASKVCDWTLYIVGPNEDGYLSRVEALVKQRGAPRVKFKPGVSAGEKGEVFRSADAFVLPSYSEGFPMVLLEAASYGLPILQTVGCNFSSLYLRGGSWLAKSNMDSLEQQLLSMLRSSPEERIHRGQLGRTLVEKEHDWKTIAEKLNDVCLSLASELPNYAA